ncbi:MAG: hypothetical protein AABX11_05905 [Nanoarchaeota archaeon]
MTKKILLIEDSPLSRKHEERLLSEKGFEVISSDNLKDAERLYSERTDWYAVISDNTFFVAPRGEVRPDLGIDLTLRIKKANPTLRVALVTSYLSGELKQRTEEEGIYAIFKSEFSNKIDDFLKE